MAQVTLLYRRHKCPLLRKHEYTQCFLNGKCLRAQNGALYEVPASYNAPFFMRMWCFYSAQFTCILPVIPRRLPIIPVRFTP